MIKMRLSLLFIAVSMVPATVITTSAQSRDLPVYEVSRTATPVKVDGKLDDIVWTKAARFRDFRNLDGSPSASKTEARALYDDNFLYLSFRCPDNNIWATMKRRDEHLWKVNLYRVEMKPAPALLAWSPTFKDDFHIPSMFGEIVFTDKVVR